MVCSIDIRDNKQQISKTFHCYLTLNIAVIFDKLSEIQIQLLTHRLVKFVGPKN